MNKACGTAAISKVFGEKRAQLKVVNGIQANVGDHVLIGLNESALLIASFLVYLLPIISLLVFALFGELMAGQLQIENSELIPILSGIFGLGLTMWWVRRKTANPEHANRFQAVILRRLSRQNDGQINI